MTDSTVVVPKLRQARMVRGLSQSELARRARISRQALSAIETGAYQPGVAVAIGLARALGESVENLFGETSFERIPARLVEASVPAGQRARVALASVGGKVIAVPQPLAALRLLPVSGIVERASSRGEAEVESFRSRAEIDATLLIAGCDPSVTIVADWLARWRAPVNVVALACSSRGALEAIVAGRAHVAGVHLRDPRDNEDNLSAVHRALGRRRATVVNFARWEIGLATYPGNRLGIHGWADLARPAVRIVNREPGSGARAALDEALAKAALEPARIEGYRWEVGGHLEVAQAIAAGHADAGVTIRVAAQAYGLDFIALREERYDLVIPESEINSAAVTAMLELLASSRFTRELTELCGYDTAHTGEVLLPRAPVSTG